MLANRYKLLLTILFNRDGYPISALSNWSIHRANRRRPRWMKWPVDNNKEDSLHNLSTMSIYEKMAELVKIDL